MTKKIKMTTDAVLNKAEILLKDLEAASRERRLRKAETEVKNAAKPKTRGGRLIAAERQVAASRPADTRCMWREMQTK